MDLTNFRMWATPISTTAIGHTSSTTLSQQQRPLATSGQGNPSRTSRQKTNPFPPRNPRLAAEPHAASRTSSCPPAKRPATSTTGLR